MQSGGDPEVLVQDLARATAIPSWHWLGWQRRGHLPRPRRSYTTLLGALRGCLAALRAEAADPTSYRLETAPIPSGSIPQGSVDGALDRIVRIADREIDRLTLTRYRPGIIPCKAADSRLGDQEVLRSAIRVHRREAITAAQAEERTDAR